MRTGRPRTVWVAEDYFDTLDAERWYWLGFIVADGCVTTANFQYQLIINLASRDKPHLAALFARLGGSLRQSVPNAWCYRACSKRLALRLADLGAVPRKSYTPVPLPPTHANAAFLRGLFDGDGCLHVTRRGHLQAAFCGHPMLVEWFVKQCGVRHNGMQMRGNTLYAQWTSAPRAKELCRVLYVPDGAPRLARKAKIAEACDGSASAHP